MGENVETVETQRPYPPRTTTFHDHFEEIFGMSSVSVGRIVVVIISILVLILGLSLCIAAFVTPAWQVVYLAEFQTEHQHGLWLDCTVNRRFQPGLNSGYQCTYKFESAFYDATNDLTGSIHQEEAQHMWHGWHQAVIAFLGIAFFSGLIALCFLFCAPCVRIAAIVANVMLLIAAISMFVSMCVFFINSHRQDIRFVHGITMTHEQSKGYSFYLGIGSFICFTFAFLVSIPSTVLIFLHDRREHSTTRKTYPNGTNKNQPTNQQPITV